MTSYLKKGIGHVFSQQDQCHVIMSLTRGQYAGFSTLQAQNFSSYPNLRFWDGKNVKILKNDNLFSTSYPLKLSMESLQRLNVEKHSREWYHHWLVGLTDGDGSFSIDPISWNLTFKISLRKSNELTLYKVKDLLQAGKVENLSETMSTYRIRDRQLLNQCVFPIFDRIPLLSDKFYKYHRMREIARLLDDTSRPRQERLKEIEWWYSQESSRHSISPVWTHYLSEQKVLNYLQTGKISLTRPEITPVISIPWLSGFLEAEGSFYIVKKDKNRYCHAFGLSQQGNGILMEAIRKYLKIKAQVKLKTPESFKNNQNIESQCFFNIETTNLRNVEFLKKLFSGKVLVGKKAQEFSIWSRSLKHRLDYEKLSEIQKILRNIRKSE